MLKQAETRLALAQGKGSFITQEEAVRLEKRKPASCAKRSPKCARKKPPPRHPPPPTAKAGEQAQKPIPPGTRTHVVKPGETMASIAQNYYKNKGRWKDIQDANFYSTNGTPKIKPGQTLIIP